MGQVVQTLGKREAGLKNNRPAVAERKFVSDIVESTIGEVAGGIADPELAWLFTNCFPNTLDTTIAFEIDSAGKPDTFVITGDIEAMWLRDSTNQVWPYLPLVKQDAALRDLFRGLINRQAACVRLDPYGNGFVRDGSIVSYWQGDHTDMRPGVYERKYELDSLCSVLRLATGYYFETSDVSCFDEAWLSAVELILQTIRREQAGFDEQGDKPYYQFQRTTQFAGDTLSNQGRGNPFRRIGLSRSPFRPSDDAATFQFLVPANAMAVVCLRDLAKMLNESKLNSAMALEASRLAGEIDAALREHAIVRHPQFGSIYAYEIDGFGGAALMDDANSPSLLALPYLGFSDSSDPIYQATRAFVLSPANPYFCRGDLTEGICSAHVGTEWIWPMSIAIRAITSSDDSEIVSCLKMLKQSHAGTGFMHESYWKNDPSRFTRRWFAWANSLLGELIFGLYRRESSILRELL